MKRWLVALAFLAMTGVVKADGNPALDAHPQEADWYMPRHTRKVAEMQRKDIDLVFIGDSITHDYEHDNFQPVWQEFYGKRHAVNLGFFGDTTPNVLWRLQHGELGQANPRAVVILIGTNNSSIYCRWPATDTVPGIEAIVDLVHQHWKRAHVILLGILPCDLGPEKATVDQAVNRALQSDYRFSGYVTYLDIGSVFMKNGKVDTSLFLDPQLTPPHPALHPSPEGQRKMAEAIEPTLSRYLR